MGIGGQLVILLAVPLVGLLTLTSYGVVVGAQRSSDASGLKQRTEGALVAYQLVDELQHQRSALVSDGSVDPASIDRVQDLLDQLNDSVASMGGDARSLARTATARISGTQDVARLGLGGNAAMSTLSPAINTLLDLATIAIDTGGSVDPAASSAADNIARAQGASAEEADFVRVLADQGLMTPENFQKLTSLAAAQRSYVGLAGSSSPSDLAVRLDRVGHGVSAADSIRQSAFSDGTSASFSEWTEGVDARTEDLRGLQSEASTLAVQEVDNLANSSRALLVLAASAAAATLLITILLLRRAVSSIAKPLEDLAAHAEEVARVHLPAAVRDQQFDPDLQHRIPSLATNGAAEVHEVAAAFGDVQDTAIRLAGEQAVLRVNQADAMTNLGRRNQTLLARQLDFITSLEAEETEPKFLEHLFRLDHLASRMRRNAESLLILAGSETPRRRRAPAEISEVIRAAMSEVEDFERIRIGQLRDGELKGPVVIDLIHLLAELIENALSFSPPDSTVEIEGSPLGQGGYQFAVIDHGVGMTDVELTESNHRLSGLEEFTGMPTRYLGQYVVAKLCVKTGAMARLQPTVGGRGVSAIVTLPASVMMDSPDRPVEIGPRPGSRASREQEVELFAPGTAVPSSGEARSEALPHPVVVSDLRDPSDHDPDPEGWDAIVDSVLNTSIGDTEPPPTEAPVVPPLFTPSGPTPTQDWSPQEIQPIPTSPPPQAPPSVEPAGTTSGSLRRRVPGASLAKRSADSIGGPEVPQRRSADEVRNRLAAFQAGRTKGRGSATREDATGTGTVSSEFGREPEAQTFDSGPLAVTDHFDDSEDWRSTK